MKKYLLIGLAFTAFFVVASFATKMVIHRSHRPPIYSTPQPPEPVPFVPRSPAPKTDLPVSTKKHKIQVALLLDTSNSMDGLIGQAKSQLWKLVNELVNTNKDGEAPGIEIALYEYGNDNLSVNSGYVRQVVPLTTDLDYISGQLFSLATNGGQEYCGWVIKDALSNLQWTDKQDDYRLIVIAGNEPFDQGSVDYRAFCKNAAEKGIIVNTIFCGDYQEGVSGNWKDGADLAQGTYANIDQNDVVQHIPTPYDQAILKLNRQLNGTYLCYGEKGEEAKSNQLVQDANASEYGIANLRTRGFVKSKSAYKNSSWDLVDAASEDKSALDIATVPEEMKNMSKVERQQFVDTKRSEREAIQKELQKYELLVEKYIAEHQQKSSDKQTLDNVVIQSCVRQAKAKGFE